MIQVLWFHFIFKKKEREREMREKKIPSSVFNNVFWPDELIDLWLSFETLSLFNSRWVHLKKKKKKKKKNFF